MGDGAWVEVVRGSEAVDRIGYDPVRRQLLVRFHSGESYIYFDVPPELAAGFAAAPSKGAFFQEEVRDRFAFTRPGT